MKVRKAVIAAAGFGTRFLPQTKAMPKEMLPLVDKPIIQYIVEELVEAGIEDIVIVTGYSKRSIEDHFDYINADLRDNLKKSGKTELLEQIKKISDLANFIYIRQKGPYGNATPVLNAEHLIGDEPFIYTWGDDFIRAKPNRFTQMIAAHEKTGGSILACLKVNDPRDYTRYGFIGGSPDGDLIKVDKIVEKPGSREDSPGELASVSGYLFGPELFDYLKQAKKALAPDQEFIFQPSIQKMIDDGHPVHGCEIKNGKFYDTGNKLVYMKTVIDFGLEDPEIGQELLDHIKSRL